jgi:RNA polymerase sigma-70 factor (ECF subfamily)
VASGTATSTADAYEQLRPLMFAIAYRMTGSVSDAEDIIQEAFLRYHRAQERGRESAAGAIESPKAYLSAVTTRLCIDQLRSARSRRETYQGEWLPEPLLTDPAAPDPAGLAEQADSLSMAFLLLLERLSPVERAIFLLHDVFGYGFGEVADIVGKSEVNCRQLAARARRHVTEQRPRFEASRRKREELADRFLRAVADGEMAELVSMLAADAVVYGDSGGTRPSWPRPITGRDNVGRLLTGLGSQIRELGIWMRRVEINGQPGALVLDANGHLTNVFVLDIADGQVVTVRSVINPAKLQHLGPLADLPVLRRELRESRAAHGQLNESGTRGRPDASGDRGQPGEPRDHGEHGESGATGLPDPGRGPARGRFSWYEHDRVAAAAHDELGVGPSRHPALDAGGEHHGVALPEQ